MSVKSDLIKYNNIEPCAVCGNPVSVDDYGNSDVCKHCGWENSKLNEEWDKSLGISYPMLVPLSRARAQYKQKVPFKATFDDFVNGLMFYSEVTFLYKGNKYAVFLLGDYTKEPYKIELHKVTNKNGEALQVFDSEKAFRDNAAIEGVRLIDIWDEVKSPSFMWCE